MAERDRILTTIGGTPLVRLMSIPASDVAEIWVKLEGTNPTGSMKDRMAVAMVEGGLARGELHSGGVVVELTGGSTGSSLAFVCAVKGLRAHFVSSDAFAEEKLATMRALGAELDIIPSVGGAITHELFQAMQDRLLELAATGGTYWTNQFANPDNRHAYHTMAEEICRDLGGVPDAFVMGVGTGGCFSGNAEALGRRNPEVRCIAVEPTTSRALSGGAIGAHRIEGIAPGFLTPITRSDLIDEIEAVSDEQAREMARRLARDEGIFAGISSGANVCAALRVAARLGPDRRVVTVAVDSGLKYLQGDLFA
jgi:cysteine synthase